MFLNRHTFPRPRQRRIGAALIVILSIITILTAVTIALFSMTQMERTSSRAALYKVQAETMAETQMEIALDTMTKAIAEGSQPGKTWASEPGRLWVFTIEPATGVISRKSVDLFSALPGSDPDNVDLNAPSMAGVFPIAPPRPGETAATMKVGWRNLLRDPSQPAAKANPLIGRVAYWVDDESCKVNINTADGTQRNATPASMAATKKYSFGFGTPSEISLAALPGLDPPKAESIAAYPWSQEFHSIDELTRVKDASGAQVVSRAMVDALRFEITHYNSSPDLNFMGEPRISLLFSPILATGSTARMNVQLGPYRVTRDQDGTDWNTSVLTLPSLPLDHLYPQPNQLPKPSYLGATDRFFLHTFSDGNQLLNNTKHDFYVGKIITSYFMGVNLKGDSFTWPLFAGADPAGFAGKYTPRQLDSITLQILDTVGKTPFCDQAFPHTAPGLMSSGWLSGKMVLGVGRIQSMTEILIDAEAFLGDPLGYGSKIDDPDYEYPCLKMKIYTEMYFPKGYRGIPQNLPYDKDTAAAMYSGTSKIRPNIFNYYDAPISKTIPANPAENKPQEERTIAPGKLGSFWMDQLLTALNETGAPAGIDFMGHMAAAPDPDQAKAASYHPYCKNEDGTYRGSINVADSAIFPRSIFDAWSNFGVAYADNAPGCYISNLNRFGEVPFPAKPGIKKIQIKGGFQYWFTGGGSLPYKPYQPLLYPLDSFGPELLNTSLSPTVIEQIKESVIPINFTLNLDPSSPVPADRKRLLLRTSDPLVALFPKDWESILNPANSDITMDLPTSGGSGQVHSYQKGGTAALDPFFPPKATVTTRAKNVNGDNIGYRPSGGGDPLSLWLPTQDTRIPKQARFPSVGALFSIRTGLFPDKKVDSKDIAEQHGVPFRVLNMAPSTQASQTTDGGTSYPDWAMLDLFTVPFLPQKPYFRTDPVEPFRRLTYGGATIGKININNPSVPYPFSESIPGVAQTPPRRNTLKALFHGVAAASKYDSNDEPEYVVLDEATSESLANAIEAYQKANGPFFMAGEIANVPAVASYLYTGVAAASISRNDLVRDTIGAITTRSNVYTIWVVAQTIQKSKDNTTYGEFEPGDKVTSEVRRRYLVERYLETGKDGVPGNGVSPTYPDYPNSLGIAGTTPDGETLNTAYHPALSYPLPYRWRVLAIENIKQ